MANQAKNQANIANNVPQRNTHQLCRGELHHFTAVAHTRHTIETEGEVKVHEIKTVDTH